MAASIDATLVALADASTSTHGDSPGGGRFLAECSSACPLYLTLRALRI
jgi:hypothetical protein